MKPAPHYTDGWPQNVVDDVIISLLGAGHLGTGYTEREPTRRDAGNQVFCLERRVDRIKAWYNPLVQVAWGALRADWYRQGVKCLIPAWAGEKISLKGVVNWHGEYSWECAITVKQWVYADRLRFIDNLNTRFRFNAYLNPRGRLVIPLVQCHALMARRHRRWQEWELETLRQHRNLPLKQLVTLFPGRSARSVENRVKRL